mmetsp:Transcript_513/g.1041  ORF Transcript_513/g.1041 Transcript_513/m.1041 type:complete len:233 (-) Transcript_513:416-1114(-)
MGEWIVVVVVAVLCGASSSLSSLQIAVGVEDGDLLTVGNVELSQSSESRVAIIELKEIVLFHELPCKFFLFLWRQDDAGVDIEFKQKRRRGGGRSSATISIVSIPILHGLCKGRAVKLVEFNGVIRIGTGVRLFALGVVVVRVVFLAFSLAFSLATELSFSTFPLALSFPLCLGGFGFAQIQRAQQLCQLIFGNSRNLFSRFGIAVATVKGTFVNVSNMIGILLQWLLCDNV